MDGVLNNAIFTNGWSIAPDALQEFAVQSHITDAQFAISSGANINVVTRSGLEFLSRGAVGVYPERRIRCSDLSGYLAALLIGKINTVSTSADLSGFPVCSIPGTIPGFPSTGRDSDPA